MSKPKVIVTRKWPAEVEAQLKALYDVQLNESDIPMTADELKKALQTADALLSTVTDSITADILNVEGKRAKIIGNFGVGYNNIDINTAKAQGLLVTNTPHVLTDCTADIAMLLLLMSARRAAEGERLIRHQQWTGWKPTQLIGQKVTGKTLGLIGFGRIAQAMAKKAHHGFGMKILFYAPSQPPQNIIGEPNIDPGFLALDNIALLPHLGSATEETRVAMGNRVLANIAAFFTGDEPEDRVV